MQNKPNLLNAQMNVSSVITKYYENERLRTRRKNKAKTNPIKPNLLNAQMNVNAVITKDYENVRLHRRGENKPKTNPIQTQSIPIFKNSGQFQFSFLSQREIPSSVNSGGFRCFQGEVFSGWLTGFGPSWRQSEQSRHNIAL